MTIEVLAPQNQLDIWMRKTPTLQHSKRSQAPTLHHVVIDTFDISAT